MNLSVTMYETGQGQGAVAATDDGVCRVFLPGDDLGQLSVNDGAAGAESLQWSSTAAHMLMHYFKGEAQDFNILCLDYSVSGPFRRMILESIRAIPFGEVRSYAQVAAAAGAAGASRAVGGAMAANPLPIIIPCHRVVAANGALTGYSAAGGLKMKQFLLRLEGVEFTRDLVNIPTQGY